MATARVPKKKTGLVMEPESAVAVKLDTATVEACLVAVQNAQVINNAEEAGRASAEAAVRRLLG